MIVPRFANKQDLPAALAQGDVAKKMQLDEKISANKWQIQDCRALTVPTETLDSRIQSGIDWLCSTIVKDFERLDARVKQDIIDAKEQAASKKAEAKEARRKRREERERKAAEEAAQAADAAMQAAEQAQVAVPMNIQVKDSDAVVSDRPATQTQQTPPPAKDSVGANTSTPSSLPPLRSVPKANAHELVLSGSPLPQNPSLAPDPNVPVSPLNKALHSIGE